MLVYIAMKLLIFILLCVLSSADSHNYERLLQVLTNFGIQEKPSIVGHGLQERGQLDPTYHAYICENQFLTIRCPIGYIIRIIESNFGRQGSTHCRGRHADQLCYTAWTIQELGTHCYWRQKCTVFASTKIFGDPCTDVDRYLSLSYQCESISGR
ncbi:D-galactoside-specific lectin-like [Mytilus trossulus]|uniref:D-galactoside-specific lectin-like n=1 Tax=Mytilus trossulus TaxID=6551 RepID=UPI003003C3DD